MNNQTALLDRSEHDVAPEALPINRARRSGFVLQEIDAPAALAVLDSFLEEDEFEQRETFAYLKHALDEARVAQNARPLFSNE
jgi:hypothetical protein